MPYLTANSAPISVWPLTFHQLWVVDKGPDHVPGQFRRLGSFEDVAELVGLPAMILRTRSVSRDPIQIDTDCNAELSEVECHVGGHLVGACLRHPVGGAERVVHGPEDDENATNPFRCGSIRGAARRWRHNCCAARRSVCRRR